MNPQPDKPQDAPLPVPHIGTTIFDGNVAAP